MAIKEDVDGIECTLVGSILPANNSPSRGIPWTTHPTQKYMRYKPPPNAKTPSHPPSHDAYPSPSSSLSSSESSDSSVSSPESHTSSVSSPESSATSVSSPESQTSSVSSAELYSLALPITLGLEQRAFDFFSPYVASFDKSSPLSLEEEDNYSSTCACKEERRLLVLVLPLELAVPPRPRPLALGVVARGLAGARVLAAGLAFGFVGARGFGFGGAGGFAAGVGVVARGFLVRPERDRIGSCDGGGCSVAAPPWGAASTSGPF